MTGSARAGASAAQKTINPRRNADSPNTHSGYYCGLRDRGGRRRRAPGGDKAPTGEYVLAGALACCPRPARTGGSHQRPADRAIPGGGIRVSGRSRHARRGAGQAHRHPRGVGVSRRRARAQGQARGALSVSRLFHARASARRPARPSSRSTGRSRREIYCRVVPITRDGGRHARARRRRRRQSNGRSRCAASTRPRRSTTWPTRDAIDAALADALGRTVAAAHARAPPVEPAPWIAALANYIDAARRRVPRDARSVLRPPRSEALRARAARPTRASVRCSSSAARQGLVRRIHGDLHLGNIVLIDGRPVLFDAIEFRPGDRVGRRALRSRLPAHGPDRARSAATPPISCSIAISLETRRVEDLDALAALPFFLSMRAAIRAKVTARAARAARRRTSAPRSAQSARSYFDLARRLHRAGGRRGWSRSAASPAPANRCSRARWRRNWRRRPARSCCARMSSARRCSARTSRHAAARSLCAGRDAAGLCHDRRQGAARARGRPFGDRRRGVRTPAGRDALSSNQPRRWACRSTAYSSPPISRRASRASARAAATPATPTRRSRARRKATISANLDWARSTPPARRRRRWSARGRRWAAEITPRRPRPLQSESLVPDWDYDRVFL